MPWPPSLVDRLAAPNTVSRSQRHLLLKPNQRLARARVLERQQVVEVALRLALSNDDSFRLSDGDDSYDELFDESDYIDNLVLCSHLLQEQLHKVQGGPRFVRTGAFPRQRNGTPIRTLHDAQNVWGFHTIEEKVVFSVAQLAQVIVSLGFAAVQFPYISPGNPFDLGRGRQFYGVFIISSSCLTTFQGSSCCLCS